MLLWGDEEPLTEQQRCEASGTRLIRCARRLAIPRELAAVEALGIPSKEQSSTHELAGAYTHCLQAFGRGTLLALLKIDPFFCEVQLGRVQGACCPPSHCFTLLH